MRRSPSTSALARSSTPAAAASRSSSSRNAVPLGSSSSGWPARSTSETRGARGQRVAVGRDQDPVLVEEVLDRHLGVGDGQVDDGQVELVGEQARARATWWWRRPRSRAPSGGRAVTSSSTSGTSQRAEVPMQPSRTVPLTSSRRAATSALSASSSAWMWRARLTTARPSSVSAPLARSTRVTPSSRSRRATWVDTFDCTVCRVRAAAEKLPASATATSTESCRRSIAGSDGSHHQQLFDELLAPDVRWCSQEEAPPPPRRCPQRGEAGSPSSPSQDTEHRPSPRAGVSVFGGSVT